MFAQQINLTDSLAEVRENYHSKKASFLKVHAQNGEKRKITIGGILSSRETIRNQINRTAKGLSADRGLGRANHRRNQSDEKIAAKIVNPLLKKGTERVVVVSHVV